MATGPALHELLAAAAANDPRKEAIVEPGHAPITYEDLAVLSDRVRDRLCALGVRPGDRVGMYLRKSVDGVAALYGILKAGAAYVPVDPGAPAARNAYIMHNCGVKALVMEERFEPRFRAEHEALAPLPALLLLPHAGGGTGLRAALDAADAGSRARVVDTVRSAPEDLAYILYTSGSTGSPRGSC